MANITADNIVRHLSNSGFVIVKTPRPPAAAILARASSPGRETQPAGEEPLGQVRLKTGRAIELR
jgi:hypothetical protein